MTLRKGSSQAKEFMAKLRAMRGKKSTRYGGRRKPKKISFRTKDGKKVSFSVRRY